MGGLNGWWWWWMEVAGRDDEAATRRAWRRRMVVAGSAVIYDALLSTLSIAKLHRKRCLCMLTPLSHKGNGLLHALLI